MNRRKKLALSCAAFLILCLCVVAYGQRIKKHGGTIDITQAGAVTITPATGQAITLGGATGVTGNFAVNTNKFTVASSSGNTVVAGTFTVGSTGTALTRIAKYTAALTPAEVAANTCAEQTFTVTGIATGDVVAVNKPTAQAGLGVAGVRASATNQVGINFCNATASPITPTAAETYLFTAIR